MHDRTLSNPVRLALAIGLAFLMAATAVIAPHSVRAGAAGQKVAIIVGPVGSLSSNYRSRGDSIANAATALGATVVKVYTPNATWANVRAAVNGANIIVYIGHGSGFPNPYGPNLLTDRSNGWGLNRIAGVDSADPTGDGDNWSTNMVYCGEAAIEGMPMPSYTSPSNWCAGGPITPAPGFVMVFSNACYAPGAGETEETTPSSQATARARVEYYSRPFLALGGTYFASDLGSRSVVEAVLENPGMAFGNIFRLGNGYSNAAVRGFPHALAPAKQAWIQKTSGPGGLMSYWYAFAGDPARTPSGGTAAYVPLPPAPDDVAPVVAAANPAPNAIGVSTTPTVTVRFNEAVMGVWAGNTVLRDNATWGVIASSVTYDPATFTASLVPDAPLQPNRLYMMAVSGSITDLAGNPLAYQYWTFQTGSAPSGPPVDETYDPPRTLYFATGTYVGRQFNAAGAITASLPYTLASSSNAPTSQHRTISGQSGTWYYITAGIWAGYWIQESPGTVLGAPVAPPPPPVDETYDPPRTLYFAAGTYVGRQFNAAGAITASLPYTLASSSNAPTSQHRTISGQSGNWYYITAGVWAGYWIQESPGTILGAPVAPPPPPVDETYDPPRTLYFAAGTYVGRQFNAAGAITASLPYTLASSSNAPTSQHRTISGQSGNWYYITAGVWAGYWIQESPGTILGAPVAPPPPPVDETYDPPRTLYFATGTYVGRQFNAAGAITASLPYTLASSSNAPTSQHRTISGQSGNWYYITAGIWAGYWIQESAGTTLGP